MAFTDRCDLFGAVHEEGINRVVRHLMRQRPSLFNYATAVFHQRPELFCARIDPARSVRDAGNPLFTEQAPLPVLGAPIPIGVNFCAQLTDAQMDFHPGNTFPLPTQLGTLAAQRFAVRLRACVGLDCPPRDVLDRLVPVLERYVVAHQQLVIDQTGKKDQQKATPALARSSRTTAVAVVPERSLAAVHGALDAAPGIAGVPGKATVPERTVLVLPVGQLLCFCLEVYVVGHLEWGPVVGSRQQWLKPRVDGMEIVDLQPTPMENAIECYVVTTLRLGILPRLIVPMEKMILDVTAVLAEQGLAIGQQVTLGPSVVPTDVPNNPAIEQDQLKAFIKLTVTEGGA